MKKNFSTINKGLVLTILGLVLTLASCQRELKFDKSKWNEQTDPTFPSPYRVQMLKDLITNEELVGQTTNKLKHLLGEPDRVERDVLIYKIEVDYGSDIDPVYTKDLVFRYSKDSIVQSFKVIEWNKP